MSNIIIGQNISTITIKQFGDGYWLGKFIGGGVPDTIPPFEIDCKCKMIRTNSSAVNMPDRSSSCNSTPTWQNQVRDQTHGSWPFGYNSVNFWDGGVLGAAKFGQMLLTVDACKDLGLKRKQIGGGGLGYSYVSFKMSCYSVGSQTIKFGENCNCEKQVTVDYAYNSHAKVSSEVKFALCGRKAKMKIEDFAIIAKSGGTSASSINSGAAIISSTCNMDKDTNFISNLTDLTETLKTVFKSGVKAAEIIGGAGTAVEFFNNIISQSKVCSEIDTAYTLVNGTETFSFNASQPEIIFTILSKATFEGNVSGNAAAFGALNSSFYMAAVLETETPSEVCCSEKIASYVLGTLDGFPISNNGTNNNMSVGVLPDLGDLQHIVGSFYGLRSPWGGNFEGTGCCDDVVIECLSQCVYFREGECSEGSSFGGSGDEGLSFRSQNFDDEIIGIVPNPVLKGNPITIIPNAEIYKMELIDFHGRIVETFYDLSLFETVSISTESLSQGMYVLRNLNQKGRYSFYKIIIQ